MLSLLESEVRKFEVRGDAVEVVVVHHTSLGDESGGPWRRSAPFSVKLHGNRAMFPFNTNTIAQSDTSRRIAPSPFGARNRVQCMQKAAMA
jgi:hypothetical protein